MKRWTYAVFAGTLAWGALSMPVLCADEKEPEKSEAQEHQDKWKEKLGLSDDQATKLKAAHEAKEQTVKPLHDQIEDAMKKLRQQIKSKAADSEIQATLDALSNAHKSIMAAEEKFKADTEAFLSPTQRGKMLLHMMHRMHERWEGHGKDKK